jgi:DNA-binding NtrC family response regulator
MVAGEIDGPEAAVAALSDIRRRVVAQANPAILAALHLCVAELESKRGLLSSAARHIEAGRTLLRNHGNIWLEGNASIDDCCLAYLRSDAGAAFNFASQALILSAESGHAATKMAACTNLAHLHMASGDFIEAERLFHQALATWRGGGANEVAILDGLAQLELARKNFAKCHSYLDQINRIEHARSTQPGYYQSWSFRTKLQLLIEESKLGDAKEFLASIQHNLARFHPALRLALAALHSELLLATNERDAAASMLASAYLSCNRQSPDVTAQLETALGKVLAHGDSANLGFSHLKRACRVFTHLKQDVLAAIVASHCRSIEPSPHQDLIPSAGAQRYSALSQIKILLDFEDSTELLAQESAELFRELGCLEQLSVMTSEIVSGEETTSSILGDVLPTHPDCVRIKLGYSGRHELQILAVPKSDLTSCVEFAAARRIVEAVVSLRSLRQTIDENAEIWPADEIALPNGIIFSSPVMQEMFRVVQKVASSNVTILITGETGTGKEVLARELHRQSRRVDKPFAPFNCAAVPRDLIESQLFGHRKGAFSGAHEHFHGVIRAAEGGTVFLDEIGELPIDVQPKLLRFLESGEVHPLGEVRPSPVDVRIVAASNANLEEGITQGRFREDLFYRLNIIRFRIPPLRERREEILPLTSHFLRKFADEFGKKSILLSEQAAECMILFSWPGNIRQLANEVRRLVALADDQFIVQLQHLSPDIAASYMGPVRLGERGDSTISVSLNQSIQAAVEHVERSMLNHALHKSAGRVEVAAKALGISRKGLYLKRVRLGIRNPL